MPGAPVDMYAVLRDLRAITDEVIVSFSGGKDSAVVLDLCLKGQPRLGIEPFKRVVPFFMYQIPGLAFEQAVLKVAEDTWGLPILRYPHPDLAGWLRTGTYRHAPDLTVKPMRMPDIFRLVRADTGLEWICGGERAADSIWRDAWMRHDTAIQPKVKRAFPVAWWKKRDVLAYVQYHRLPLSPNSGSVGNLTSMNGYSLYTLRERFPEDYARVLDMFPFAGAAVFQYEQRLKEAQARAGADEAPAV